MQHQMLQHLYDEEPFHNIFRKLMMKHDQQQGMDSVTQHITESHTIKETPLEEERPCKSQLQCQG